MFEDIKKHYRDEIIQSVEAIYEIKVGFWSGTIKVMIKLFTMTQ